MAHSPPTLEELAAAVLARYERGERCPAELEEALRRRLLGPTLADCPPDCPVRRRVGSSCSASGASGRAGLRAAMHAARRED